MILITSGCSFSECNSGFKDTWPKQLEKQIVPKASYHEGLHCQGNGLISRKLIYRVTELLKKNRAEELLVGIMWSSHLRHDFFHSNISFDSNIDNWLHNPTGFVDNSSKNWIIIQPWWNNDYAKIYYRDFFDDIGAYVYTLEHILRTQWFLKSHNIKYFMSMYMDHVLPDMLSDNKHTKHLYEQIDLDQFLPAGGEYEWCKNYSGLAFSADDDSHPTAEQHKLFTEKVIIPFCKDKNYL